MLQCCPCCRCLGLVGRSLLRGWPAVRGALCTPALQHLASLVALSFLSALCSPYLLFPRRGWRSSASSATKTAAEMQAYSHFVLILLFDSFTGMAGGAAREMLRRRPRLPARLPAALPGAAHAFAGPSGRAGAAHAAGPRLGSHKGAAHWLGGLDNKCWCPVEGRPPCHCCTSGGVARVVLTTMLDSDA